MAIEQISGAGMHVFQGQPVGYDFAVDTSAREVVLQAENAMVNFGTNKLSDEEVKASVKELNKLLGKRNTGVKFDYHTKLNQVMVSIIDTDTNEVLREIPPKKILDTVADMMINAGLIVDRSI